MVVALEQLHPLHQRLLESARPANKMTIPVPMLETQRGSSIPDLPEVWR